MKVSIPANKNDAYNLDTFIYCMDLVVICYMITCSCSFVALSKHGTIKFVSVSGCIFFPHVKSLCQNMYI